MEYALAVVAVAAVLALPSTVFAMLWGERERTRLTLEHAAKTQLVGRPLEIEQQALDLKKEEMALARERVEIEHERQRTRAAINSARRGGFDPEG